MNLINYWQAPAAHRHNYRYFPYHGSNALGYGGCHAEHYKRVFSPTLLALLLLLRRRRLHLPQEDDGACTLRAHEVHKRQWHPDERRRWPHDARERRARRVAAKRDAAATREHTSAL